ncbi:MAG: EF-hand domain-containing protein [Gammaproteobacteria bacterium]
MVSQVSSSAGFSAAMLSGSQCRGPRDSSALQEKLFSKLDVNGDGGIDASELGQFMDFATSSTSGASQAGGAADLFKSLDTDGDGSLSKTELSDGAKKLFDELRTQLISSASGTPDAKATANRPEKPDASQLFATIDSNGDGSIDQSELGTFLQSKPAGPPSGGHHGGGVFSKIESLLDQYRSTATDSTSETKPPRCPSQRDPAAGPGRQAWARRGFQSCCRLQADAGSADAAQISSKPSRPGSGRTPRPAPPCRDGAPH